MKKAILLAAMLTVPIVPAVAQPPDEPNAPGAIQYDNSCPTDRLPGQFVVFIGPEAPQEPLNTDMFPPENVVYTDPDFGNIPMPIQLLYYPEIAAIEDPCERLTAEEAKRDELEDIAGEGTVFFNTPGYAPLVPSE